MDSIDIIPRKQEIKLNKIGFITNRIPNSGEETSSAPSYEGVFRWFRKKHNKFCSVDYKVKNGVIKWFYVIKPIQKKHPKKILTKNGFDSYEDARFACLKRLIKNIKKGK